jgi:hypothetical protein
VEAAIRKMDDFCYPIVLLSRLPCESSRDAFGDEDAFNVIGGAGRYALFQMTGPWRYEDPAGGNAETRLWESDQGYFCQEKHVLTDISKVLRLAKAYYSTGSYDQLDEIE